MSQGPLSEVEEAEEVVEEVEVVGEAEDRDRDS